MLFGSFAKKILEPAHIGLDISDLTIKAAHIDEKHGAPELTAYGRITLPPGIITDGVIENEVALADILRTELKDSHGKAFTETFVTACLPEEKSYVRIIELPKIEDHDLPNAVRWELESAIPMPEAEIYYDFEPLPGVKHDAKHRDVLVTAFPRVIVDSYLRALKRAGLRPLALELESQAISRALVPIMRESPPTILVDIGAMRTSLIVFSSGAIFFTKSIPVGGKDFDAAIARVLGVSIEEARKKKVENDTDPNKHDRHIFDAVSPTLEPIAAELKQTIDFVHNRLVPEYPELHDIAAILLCGGEANLSGLTQFLSSRLEKPVQHANPFRNFIFERGVVPPIPKREALEYTTAIGLGLRRVNA
jgi:type IV pilus assembly protein PilM